MTNLTKYEVGKVVEIHGTYGIAVDKGEVTILGIVNSQLVPDFQISNWIDGLEPNEIPEIYSEIWIVAEYYDKDSHSEWGIMYFPKFAFDEVTKPRQKS